MNKDEFNWGAYPSAYAQQKAQLMKSHTHLLTEDNHDLVAGQIIMRQGAKPLHAQHKILYETILEINPADVHEFGCGWGDHLANIRLLNPNIEVFGSDISAKQIEEASKRHEWMKHYLWQLDITKAPDCMYDLVYTQAVLIHLSDDNLKKAILNIAISARRYILMEENFFRRDYIKIFREINPTGWEDANIEKMNRDDASIIIISR